MSKKIKITADERIPRYPLANIEGLQGELKSLSDVDGQKLRDSIEKHGFFAPLFIWENKGKYKLLDGHQRVALLSMMRDKEGVSIPDLPAVTISAKNENEAKEKLLLITSQFGKVDKQGLYEFLSGMEIEMQSVVTQFSLAGIDGLKFLDEFVNDGSSVLPPMEPVAGTLSSVGGNGVKMLQLFFTEEQHQKVLQLIQALQKRYQTENATDTVKRALEDALEANSD